MLTPKQIAQDSELFAKHFLKIKDKQGKIVPFNWNTVQRDFHLRKTHRSLILKARHLGFTTYIQGEAYRKVVTSSQSAITLAHDDDLTMKIRLMADRFHENCKFNGIQPARKFANATLTTYPDYGSEVYIGTAGNVSKGRGGTYTLFHGTEVAFWPDAEAIIAGAMQGGNPDVILESTANGAQGYFYQLCLDALAGRGEWSLSFYPWFANPEYVDDAISEFTKDEIELVKQFSLTPEQLGWRRKKVAELKRMFAQEYPETVLQAFLMSGEGYFADVDLTHTFEAPHDAQYNPSHQYVGGLDFGKANDYTYLPVIDRTENVQVDYIHLRQMPWKEQRRHIRNIYEKWHLSGLKAEENSIGDVNIEALEEDGLQIERFTTDNASKNDIMSRLHDGLENGLKLLDWDVQKSELFSIQAKQTPSGLWAISAPQGLHDDTVMGLALAYTAKIKKHRPGAESWSNS